MENKPNYLGTCPVCGKGKIVEGQALYKCDFATPTEKCDFHIYKNFNGAEITSAHVEQLINENTTETIEFTSKSSEKYNGTLSVEDGKIKVNYEYNNENLERLQTPCPFCSGEVLVFQSGFGCENFHKKEEKCKLWINKTIAKRELETEEVEELLTNGRTQFLSGFENNSGNEFTTQLVLNQDGGLDFDSVVCKCPKCGGDIRIGNKAYSCSNWKEKKCDFSIWREIAYREITPIEARSLCENKATDVLEGFQNKEKTKSFSGRLIMSDDFQIKII